MNARPRRWALQGIASAPAAKVAAAILAALCLAGMARAEKSIEGLNERLQLGGLVSLDNTSSLAAADNPDLSLSQVALGANVTLSKELLASVVLKAEGDLGAIFFDQAMASLHPEGSPWTLLFGQQPMNHGLLTTRLISDPEILPAVELSLPGVTASYAWNAFTAGTGITILRTGLESGESRDYALVPNLDWTQGPATLRVSGTVSRFHTDADGAISLALGPVNLDAEGYSELAVWDARTANSGYYLGAEWALTPSLSLAVRHDGIAADRFSSWQAFRYGAGMTFTLKRDLFAACEYGFRQQLGEQADNRIALQVGLKSDLELPGFQRKTLTQD